LVVLDKHPLQTGEDGPVLTMTADDLARLFATVRQNGSYVNILAGEQLTERQMIQGVMLASANNLADSLAIWAFGSLEDYKIAAQAWLTKHQLFYTAIGADASGLDAGTQSSSLDLCKLTLMATANPTLSEIMNTAEVNDFPVVGRLRNTNRLLGQGGIFAGKTGYTEEAGHGVVLAARVMVGDQSHLVAMTVLGQSSYDAVFAAAQRLLDNIGQNLAVRQIAQKGQSVGYMTSPWGAKTDLVAGDNLTITTWLDETPNIRMSSYDLAKSALPAGEIVGKIMVANQSIDVVTSGSLGASDTWWRLLHGF
jgi:D-alanyl-D-alanine carboxypeptidase (penicillin-binding protein 5/6)